MLRVKYPQFLNCCKLTHPHSELTEAIESLAYGTQDSKNLSSLLVTKEGNPKEGNYSEIINVIANKYNLSRYEVITGNVINSPKKKSVKKSIKEIMIENYFLKIRREQGFTINETRRAILKLNLKLFLKKLPLKDVFVEDGEIISISNPIIDQLFDKPITSFRKL
jgi:hypothetical protein